MGSTLRRPLASVSWKLGVSVPVLLGEMVISRLRCGTLGLTPGGLLRPHYFSHYTEFEESCPGHGKALIDHEVAHLQAFADLMKEESIDCSYAQTHTYGVAMAPEGMKYFQNEYDTLKKDHGEEAVAMVEKFEGQEAEKVTRIKGAMSAWKYPGGQM